MRSVETERRDKLALVSEEAAEWFVRLKDDGLTEREQEEYLVWLKSSPNHIAEALRMGRMFARARRAGLKSSMPDEEASNIIDLNPKQEAAPAQSSAPERDRSGWRSWSLAAVLPALALGALLLIAREVGWLNGAIETEASEWRSFVLPDGSIVRAGPRTRLQVRFDAGRRLIQLPDGEAVFEVAKDAARPFFVDAGTAVVRAVGTEFGISRKDSNVLVTVAEGVVAVSQPLPQSGWFKERRRHEFDGSHNVAVSAGQQAAVPQEGPVTVQRVNSSHELAWARRRLVFGGETVAEAIEEFNQRNRIQIVVEDSKAASCAVFGAFDAGDPESFAKLIAKVVRGSVVRSTPGVLSLQPKGGLGGEAASVDQGDLAIRSSETTQ